MKSEENSIPEAEEADEFIGETITAAEEPGVFIEEMITAAEEPEKEPEEEPKRIIGWSEDSTAMAEIMATVENITDESSPDYVPPEKRIAVFDFDGTLCATEEDIVSAWRATIRAFWTTWTGGFNPPSPCAAATARPTWNAACATPCARCGDAWSRWSAFACCPAVLSRRATSSFSRR